MKYEFQYLFYICKDMTSKLKTHFPFNYLYTTSIFEEPSFYVKWHKLIKFHSLLPSKFHV